MKLLLDTHAFIWWDGEQSRLSPTVLAACQSPENTLHLSLASVWAMQIKIQLGKLSLRVPLAEVLEDQRRNGVSIESVTLPDILALSSLPALHRDPFDRMLVAQAKRGGFQLVSHDPQLPPYRVSVMWWEESADDCPFPDTLAERWRKLGRVLRESRGAPCVK